MKYSWLISYQSTKLGLLLMSVLLSIHLNAVAVELGDYHALLIGNQNYNSHDWANLSTPHADVDALGKMLKNNFGFDVLVREDLGRGEIIDLIEDYKLKLTDRDSLLIYYAGHGHMREDGGYWIGVNGKKNSRSDWLKYTTISDLLDNRSGMHAKHVFVVADSCYSGVAYRDNSDISQREPNESDAQWIKRMVETPARIILTSGGNQPVVDQIGNATHSVFASELLNKLALLVSNNKAEIGHDLYRDIAPEVHHRTKRYIRDAQAPEYKRIPGTGDQGGDFLFKPIASQLPEVTSIKNKILSPLATRDQLVSLRNMPKATAIKSRMIRTAILDSHIYMPGDVLKLRLQANSSKIRSFALFDMDKGQTERVEAKFSKENGIYLLYKIPVDVSSGSYSLELFIQELDTSNEERHNITFNVKMVEN